MAQQEVSDFGFTIALGCSSHPGGGGEQASQRCGHRCAHGLRDPQQRCAGASCGQGAQRVTQGLEVLVGKELLQRGIFWLRLGGHTVRWWGLGPRPQNAWHGRGL